MMEKKYLSNFEVLRLVRDSQSTKHSQRLVLNALALRANPEKGYSCFPSLDTLAADTQLNPKTVRESLAELRNADLISTREQAYSSSLYFLNVKRLQEQAAEKKIEKVKNEEVAESPFDEPVISDEIDAASLMTGGGR